MAETLTYDAGTDTTTTSENLNAEEQDSLEVGEALEEQQETLLAGKYKDAQELEKAYVELQKKMGDSSQEETTEEAPKAEETEEKSEEKEEEKEEPILDKLWDEKEKGFSNELLEKLAKTNPGELAKQYLRYREEASKNQPRKLNDNDVTQLKNLVGGEKEYKNLIKWAETNVSEQEQKMYDAVMDRGDPLACYFAVQSLRSKYNDKVGTDGKLITGKAPSKNNTTFKSQAELVKAMSDSRYDEDPAYRASIMEKLDRSNINF